jgi:prefoldin subunit 5
MEELEEKIKELEKEIEKKDDEIWTLKSAFGDIEEISRKYS